MDDININDLDAAIKSSKAAPCGAWRLVQFIETSHKGSSVPTVARNNGSILFKDHFSHLHTTFVHIGYTFNPTKA